MKEKMMKLGVLAIALVLAFVFAACAQPTEETAAPGTPAIIRLYLDRPETKTLKAGAEIVLRAGEQFAAATPVTGLDGTNPVLAGSWGSTVTSNLASDIPEVGYFESGALSLVDGAKISSSTTTAGGIPIVVTSDAQYYVDFELVNHTINLLEKGSSLSDTYSLYLELLVVDDDGSGTGNLPLNVYYYTPEKTSWNDWDGTTWTTDQRNIQTVDIGPGVNELYLSQFSSGN